jgi:transposase
MLMVSVSLKEQLQEGTFEEALDYLIDHKIDTRAFDKRYHNDEVGRPAWDPKTMLKIVLFAYSRGIVSSREMARACEENVTFMALTGDARPHFTVIAEFISTMEKRIIKVFRRILMICSEMELIGGERMAIDGCKLSSNASKEWSGTKEQLRKKKEKLEAVIGDMVKRHRQKDKDDEGGGGGVGERIEKLKQKVERISEFLESHEEKEGKRGRELQSNITDNESAKMQTSHGMVQGYNGVALVDEKHQVIVAAEAFGSGPEQELLAPMIEGAKENLEAIGKGKRAMEGVELLGDTGYHTEDNCKRMEDEQIDAYLPDVNYRQRDPRFKDAKDHKPPPAKVRFTIKDFTHDAKTDRYICPAGKELRLEKRAARIKDYIGRQYKARQKDCQACPLKAQCLSSEKTKERYLFIVERRYDKNYSEAMIKKIDTASGRDIYSHRMGIVEPVFGNLRWAKGLDHFTLRGKVKVTIQWMLYAIVHNIGKIVRYGQDRFRTMRRDKKTHVKMTHSKLSYGYG